MTGLWFPGFSFSFLKIRITLSSFLSAGTSCSSAVRLLKNHRKRFCGDIIQCFEDPWMNTIRPYRFLGIQLWKTEAKNVKKALNTSTLSMSLFLRWPSSSHNGLNVILLCLLPLYLKKNSLLFPTVLAASTQVLAPWIFFLECQAASLYSFHVTRLLFHQLIHMECILLLEFLDSCNKNKITVFACCHSQKAVSLPSNTYSIISTALFLCLYVHG